MIQTIRTIVSDQESARGERLTRSDWEWGEMAPYRLVTGDRIGGDIVKCCGWWRAHPDGLSGGFDVSVLKFNALEDEFNEFVTV